MLQKLPKSYRPEEPLGALNHTRNLAEFLPKSGDPMTRRTKPQTSAIWNALIFRRVPCGLMVCGKTARRDASRRARGFAGSW